MWKTFGKKGRVIGADGGGTTSALQILLDAGIAEYWPIDQWDGESIFASLDKATKGWWPEDPATPNSTLLAPTKDIKYCPKCGGDSGASGLTSVPKCAACGFTYPTGTILKTKREPINGFEDVGLVAFEGFTSFGDLLLRRLKTIDPNGGLSISDGAFKISSPGQQHYGQAQSYLGQFVANNRTIPVPVVMWTALELRGEEEGKPLYGPKGPGRALTSMCIPWFTDVLHLDGVAKRSATGIAVKDANGQEILERKLYLAPHFPSDAPTFRFAAKTSAPQGGEMPTVIEPNFETFIIEREKAYQKAKRLILGE
jgi:hypothetical protein